MVTWRRLILGTATSEHIAENLFDLRACKVRRAARETGMGYFRYVDDRHSVDLATVRLAETCSAVEDLRKQRNCFLGNYPTFGVTTAARRTLECSPVHHNIVKLSASTASAQ